MNSQSTNVFSKSSGQSNRSNGSKAISSAQNTQQIRLLNQNVIDLIKAGEVVERPLSIVKECFENSCDAGATEIHIELVEAGRKLIRITDNGCGIKSDELKLAFARHATSKLNQFEDLEELATYGFRGEALSSIGAVSRLTISSRTESSPVAYKITQNCGEFETTEPVAVSQNIGTVLEVQNLFERFPVRAKFLKSLATEFSHVSEFLQAMGFLFPNVTLKFTHNSREIFFIKSSQSLQTRFNSIAGSLAPQFAFFEGSDQKLSVQGFLQFPEFASSTSKMFYVFVNGRFVTDKIIKNAVVQAYEGLSLKGLVPSCVLFLQLPARDVDVNVHPAKTQVRFSDGLVVQDFVFQEVRNALRRLVQKKFESKQEAPREIGSEPRFKIDVAQTSFENVRPHFLTSTAPRIENPAPRIESPAPRIESPAPRIENIVVQETNGFLSHAKFVGQFHNCYLVFESNEDMLIVDQHAFHERILHEKFLASLRGKILPRQSLLSPLLLALPLGFRAHEKNLLAFLDTVGFESEWLSNGNQIAVHSIPSFLPSGKGLQLLDECCARFAASLPELFSDEHPLLLKAKSISLEQNSQLSIESVFHLSAATIACHSAVRSGDALGIEVVNSLIVQSKDVDFSAHCPHGRKVYKKFNRAQIEEWFFRI